MVRRTSTIGLRWRPRDLVAQGGDPALQLGDRPVDGGEVLGGARRQRAVELGQRAGGRQLAGALDRRPLQLAAQMLLELAHEVAIELDPAGAVAAPALEAEVAPDPLHVDADHARALATASEGADRQPGEVAHLAVVAGRDRLADRLAQLVEVEALAALEALLGDPPLERLRLGGAEEVAVEEQLEHAPVLLRLGDGRGQRLAEVARVAPGHLVERLEGVEDLRGADRDALGAQLLEEGEQLAGGSGRLAHRQIRRRRRARCRPGRRPRSPRRASPRPARRPGRCRSGA